MRPSYHNVEDGSEKFAVESAGTSEVQRAQYHEYIMHLIVREVHYGTSDLDLTNKMAASMRNLSALTKLVCPLLQSLETNAK
jgi:hypothetical protein